MNRKFRAWDNENKCFNDSIKIDMNGDLYPETDLGQYDYSVTCKSISIEYSSGKPDKNGKEMYEGDLVKVSLESLGNRNGNHTNPYQTICEVIYEDGCFVLVNKKHHSKNSRNWNKRTFRHADFVDFEIIGNIHLQMSKEQYWVDLESDADNGNYHKRMIKNHAHESKEFEH